LGIGRDEMKDKVEKRTLKIHSVEDLYEAIQHFDRMYGIEESKLTFPDGLPLVSLTYVRRTFKDGARTSELIFSDQ
jgi:hypothetical protein